MPHSWNDKIVVTKDELVPVWYPSWYALKFALHTYKDRSYGIKRARIGGGGHELLIDFDSLSKEIQEGLGDPRKVDHVLERFYQVDKGAVVFFSTYTFTDGSYLDMRYQERYIINASVLLALKHLREIRIRERNTKGISCKKGEILQTLCDDAASFNTTLKVRHKVEHTLPPGAKSFKEVLNEFEAIGYPALISKKHKNDNSRKVTEDTLTLLNSMFASDKDKPTATEVHRRYDLFIAGKIDVISDDTGEVYNPKKFKALGDSTVKRYMAAWVNKIGTYQLRSTNRQTLMQQFKPYHSLGRPKFAGSIISIDDRQPPFKDLSGKRVWFYNAIDLGSEVFTCAVYGTSKEGIILEFYRQLLRNYNYWGINLPAEVECEMSLNSSFKDTFLREGAMFRHVRIEANNARGKRIERYFRTLRYEYEKDREGWLARPHALSESNQPAIEIEKVKRIPYEDIVSECMHDIEKWNSHKHSVHTQMTRWEVFQNMQNPDTTPTNYIAILPHIGYKTITSCNAGIMRLQHREYLLGIEGKVALGERLINLMKQVEGEQVVIYWLDDHEGNVFKALVFIDSQYICEAIAKPLYNRAKIEQGNDDQIARVTMSAYVATIEGFGRKQKKSIDKVTIISNQPPEPVTFTMPGYNRKKITAGNGELLPPLPTEDFDLENLPTRTFSKPLKDRF